jgi:hypothetical protein
VLDSKYFTGKFRRDRPRLDADLRRREDRINCAVLVKLWEPR